MAKPRLDGATIKLRDPDFRTSYRMDDEGNETDEKYNPMAKEKFNPLYKFSYDEIKDGTKYIGKDNITNEAQVRDIVNYLNNRASSGNNSSMREDLEGPGNYDFEYTLNDDGKKIFSSFEERQAWQDRKRRRVENRLAQEEQDADRDKEDVIETVEDDPFLQGNVDRVDKMFTEMRDPGGGYAQYLPSNSDFDQAGSSIAAEDDPTKNLLDNYINRIIQEKTQRFRA